MQIKLTQAPFEFHRTGAGTVARERWTYIGVRHIDAPDYRRTLTDAFLDEDATAQYGDIGWLLCGQPHPEIGARIDLNVIRDGQLVVGVRGEPQVVYVDRTDPRLAEWEAEEKDAKYECMFSVGPESPARPARAVWTYAGRRERSNGELGTRIINDDGQKVGLPFQMTCPIGSHIEVDVVIAEGCAQIASVPRVTSGPRPGDARIPAWQEDDRRTHAAWQRRRQATVIACLP